EFLNRYLPTQPGPMLTPDGCEIGRHQGLAFHTLGQRKGLGIGGVRGAQRDDGTADAWYAARKDLANNVLYVVQGHDHPWLPSEHLSAQDASWVAGEPPAPGAYAAKTRYRQADSACLLRGGEGAECTLGFGGPQGAVPPGQPAGLYDGDVCLGGGIIV